MNTDPLDLTRQDRDALVAWLTRARESWLAEDSKPKTVKKAGGPAKVEAPKDLTLEDLGLDFGDAQK